MQLDIGHFKDFKGADTLLLSGQPAEIERLVEVIREFAESGNQSLVLDPRGHRIGGVNLGLTAASSKGNGGFQWLITPATAPVVAGMLRAIAQRAPAHQQFELVGSETQLVVASGEYPPDWWWVQA